MFFSLVSEMGTELEPLEALLWLLSNQVSDYTKYSYFLKTSFWNPLVLIISRILPMYRWTIHDSDQYLHIPLIMSFLSLIFYLTKYDNYRVIKTAELDTSKNYIFGSHPHGVLSSGYPLSWELFHDFLCRSFISNK